MIYDCFAFFNELDLLDIRLRELNGVVDKFVLVEATRTFQKKPKPLYFEENKERFKEFLPKIIHVVVDEYPTFFNKFRVPTVWDYDNHQKEQILRGLKGCKSEDVIIVSDLDEIPRASAVKEFANTTGVKVFEQRLYYYFLNAECNHFNTNGEHYIAQYNRDGVGYWRGSVMMPYKALKTIKKARNERDIVRDYTVVIPDSGWHFSYLGGLEKILYKLSAYAHPENLEGGINADKLREAIEAGKSMFDEKTTFHLVAIDEKMPLAVFANQEQYHHLISRLA